jgi:hypothetical protein
MKETLYSLHRKSGRSFAHVLEVVRRHDMDSPPKTPEAIAMTLRRGTDRLAYLRGFAEAWDQPLSAVESAAQETRRLYRETGQLVTI